MENECVYFFFSYRSIDAIRNTFVLSRNSLRSIIISLLLRSRKRNVTCINIEGSFLCESWRKRDYFNERRRLRRLFRNAISLRRPRRRRSSWPSRSRTPRARLALYSRPEIGAASVFSSSPSFPSFPYPSPCPSTSSFSFSPSHLPKIDIDESATVQIDGIAVIL